MLCINRNTNSSCHWFLVEKEGLSFVTEVAEMSVVGTNKILESMNSVNSVNEGILNSFP